MELKVSTVIVLVDGIVNSVRAFTTEDEAKETFISLIKAREEGVTEDDIKYFCDTGDYDDESGYNLVLAHSEGDNWGEGKDGTAEGLAKHLIRNYNDDTPVAYAIWQDEDVRLRAEEMDIEGELTDEEVKAVLYYVHKNQDCCYGISWDTIDDTILWVVNERE